MFAKTDLKKQTELETADIESKACRRNPSPDIYDHVAAEIPGYHLQIATSTDSLGGEVNAECTPSPIKGWRDSDPNPCCPQEYIDRSGIRRDAEVIMGRVVTLLPHAETKQGGSLASTNGYRQANIIAAGMTHSDWGLEKSQRNRGLRIAD